MYRCPQGLDVLIKAESFFIRQSNVSSHYKVNGILAVGIDTASEDALHFRVKFILLSVAGSYLNSGWGRQQKGLAVTVMAAHLGNRQYASNKESQHTTPLGLFPFLRRCYALSFLSRILICSLTLCKNNCK